MSTSLVLAVIAALGAFGGIATGIVALRKVGTDNIVAVRSVASTEADSTMDGLAKFNQVLRDDNIATREQLKVEREEHDKTRALLVLALKARQ